MNGHPRHADPAAGVPDPAQPEWRAGWSVRLALAWSAITAALALAWASGLLPSPLTDTETASPGAVFNGYDPLIGTAFTLVLGLLGIGCAIAALRATGEGTGRATVVGAWLMAATTLLVLVHGKLLAFLGYTPVTLALGWFLPGMWPAYLEALFAPETLFLLHCLVGGLVWGMAALTRGRAQRGACSDCGRTAGWSLEREEAVRGRALRVGRVAVAVAVVSALCYPAVRLPWLFGIPVGMDAESWARLQAEPGVVETGIGLGTAGLAGVVLMLGLVRNWGVRFPRWMAGLAGRRVPVALAVLPASVVAIALASLGREVVLAWPAGGFSTPLGADWAHVGPLAAMLPWGLALAVATVAYAVRRRAVCGACGQGRPEELPR